MLSLRARIFIVISLIVLVVTAIILLVLWQTRRANTPVAPDQAGENGDQTTSAAIDNTNFTPGAVAEPGGPTTVPAGTPIRQPTTTEAEQRGAREFAKVFVERYGSYTTDNDFQNILDLKPLVTAALWTRLSSQLQQPAGSGFVSVITAVASSELTSWANASAVVTVRTVRKQKTDGTADVSSQQTIVVTLQRNGNEWLVDSFKIQP